MLSRTIVLLHGMWSTANTLSRLQSLFENRQYRVYSPNLPCHEEGSHDSKLNIGNLSILDYTRYLRDYIDNLQLVEYPILIGHSMGGLLAQKLCAEINVAALILLAPASPAGINIINPSSAWSTLNVIKWGFWRKSQRPTPYRARYALFNLLDGETQDRFYLELIPESGRAFFEIVYWFFDRQKATYVNAKQVTAPMLVIAGGKDRLIRKYVVKRVADKYPQAEYRCYEDHSHWLIDEHGTEGIVYDIDVWLKARLNSKTELTY